MKVLLIIAGTLILAYGLHVITGVTEISQTTAGNYITCYGLYILLDVLNKCINRSTNHN